MNLKSHRTICGFLPSSIPALVLIAMAMTATTLLAQLPPSPFLPPASEQPSFVRPVPVPGPPIQGARPRRTGRRARPFPDAYPSPAPGFPVGPAPATLSPVPQTFYGPTPIPVGPALIVPPSADIVTRPTTWDFAGLKSLTETSRNTFVQQNGETADYNFYILMSEKFANRALANPRTDAGELRDFVLGADVFGIQRTDTLFQIDLRPSSGSIQLDAVLNGMTNSTTVGVTPQATINSVGNYQFRAIKPIHFDGLQFSTQKPGLYVNVRNQVLGAQTNLTGLPVLGRMADRIAIRAAQSRQPQSDEIARQKVAERVLPTFNRELDKILHDANVSLKDLRPRLETAGLVPQSEYFGSTDTHGSYSVLLMGEGESGGTRLPPPDGTEQSGLVLCIHESMLNNILGRLGLEGTAMTDRQLSALAKQGRALILGNSLNETQSLSAETDSSEPSYIVLDNHQPVRVEIVDDRVVVHVRAGFEPAGKDPIPTQLITIPVGLEIRENTLVISSDPVSVVEPDPIDDATLDSPTLEPILVPQGALQPAEPAPELRFAPPAAEELGVSVQLGPAAGEEPENSLQLIPVNQLDEEPAEAPQDTPDAPEPSENDPTFLGRFMRAVRAGILKQKLESKLPPIVLPRQTELPMQGNHTFPIRVQSVRAHDGWLIISFDE